MDRNELGFSGRLRNRERVFKRIEAKLGAGRASKSGANRRSPRGPRKELDGLQLSRNELADPRPNSQKGDAQKRSCVALKEFKVPEDQVARRNMRKELMLIGASPSSQSRWQMV